jgi:hypothetical protein
MGAKACRAQADFHYYYCARFTAAEQGEESHHAELMQNIIAVQRDISPVSARAQGIAGISIYAAMQRNYGWRGCKGHTMCRNYAK